MIADGSAPVVRPLGSVPWLSFVANPRMIPAAMTTTNDPTVQFSCLSRPPSIPNTFPSHNGTLRWCDLPSHHALRHPMRTMSSRSFNLAARRCNGRCFGTDECARQTFECRFNRVALRRRGEPDFESNFVLDRDEKRAAAGSFHASEFVPAPESGSAKRDAVNGQGVVQRNKQECHDRAGNEELDATF